MVVPSRDLACSSNYSAVTPSAPSRLAPLRSALARLTTGSTSLPGALLPASPDSAKNSTTLRFWLPSARLRANFKTQRSTCNDLLAISSSNMMVACGELVFLDERQSAGLKTLCQKLLRPIYPSFVASMVITLRDGPGRNQAGALEHRQVPRSRGL